MMASSNCTCPNLKPQNRGGLRIQSQDPSAVSQIGKARHVRGFAFSSLSQFPLLYRLKL